MEDLIKEIHIRNFKCFNEFTIKNFNRLNIFYGYNNAGKTTLLEAIYIAFSNASPNNIFLLLRNFPLVMLPVFITCTWDLLFFKLDSKKDIELELLFENSDNLNIKIRKPSSLRDEVMQNNELRQFLNFNSLLISWIFKQKSLETVINISPASQKFGNTQENIYFTPFPSFIPPAPFAPIPQVIPYGDFIFPLKPIVFFTHTMKPTIQYINYIYGEIVNANLKNDLLDSIKKIRPEVVEIDMITFAGVQSVGVKLKNSDIFYPINTVGEGFLKMFMLIILLLNNRNGILLIDEIENGLHWKVQPVLWELVESLAIKFNVQLFITTHSYEFLGNVVSSTKHPECISGFTIIKKPDIENIEYLELRGNSLKEAIESKIEVR